ncbi:MAG: hypothetical protein ACWGO1_10460 [Anaerolineales bacterium]
MRPEYRPYIKRLLVIFAISFVAMLVITEGAYLLQRDETDRGPKTVQLVIPAGASQRVAEGEYVDVLPDNSVFVIGDVLEVVNQDSTDHQLGPIWVPAGSTGRIVLEEANKFSYSCSFTPSRYLGLDVKKPTTMMTRLTGLSISVPTTAAFLFIYSFLVYPIKPKSTNELKGVQQ